MVASKKNSSNNYFAACSLHAKESFVGKLMSYTLAVLAR